MNREMVESYLRDLIAGLTDEPRPEPDADGDLPVAHRGSQCYARVVTARNEFVVQTFSVVCEVDYTQELGDALNDLNHILVFVRAFHTGGQFLLENDIFADDLNLYTFSRGLTFLADATTDVGPQVLERFGGTPRFDPEAYAAADPPEDPAPGLYL